MLSFKYSVLILFAFFIFSGCSSTSPELPENEVEYLEDNSSLVQEEVEDDSFDDMLDEFEEETKIKTTYDPFSGYNRAMTTFNDVLFENVLSPIAKGYDYTVHREIRSSVDKFFHNAFFPTRFLNNLLQGKFSNAMEESGRFIINTTIGILGFFDPAKSLFELEAHEEDFGQTLGFYGVGSGPHIVLPFFGPSNLRDVVGMTPDSFTNPFYYNDLRVHNITDNYGQYIAIEVLENVNYISLHLGDYEKLKEDAIDLYPYLRDVYEQYRDNQIKE